jgi:hypothetical protein
MAAAKFEVHLHVSEGLEIIVKAGTLSQAFVMQLDDDTGLGLP